MRLIFIGICLSIFPLQGFAEVSKTIPVDVVDSSRVVIRNTPISVAGSPEVFTLSVLGFEHDQGFSPLLAIAIYDSGGIPNEWIALWNLSDADPGWLQNFKAAIPGVWAARDGGNANGTELLFPKPVITWNEQKGGAWKRIFWTAAKVAARWSNLFFPFQVGLHSFVHNRTDRMDRQFHQVYTLLSLYEQMAVAEPEPRHLSHPSLLDLKYRLLANAHAVGALAAGRPAYEVVQEYESQLRKQTGQAASYLHSQATFYGLGFQEVHYGLAGRPPVSRAALLFVRKSDLTGQQPAWPGNDPFDLGYNPFEHEEIRRLIDEHPDETIPIAFYVLTGDFRIKPVIVANFFNSGRARDYSSAVRITLDHFLAVGNLSLRYRTLQGFLTWSMQKKDYSYFSDQSTASGVESVAVLTRIGGNLDSEMQGVLLDFLQRRVMNPMTASFRQQSLNAQLNYAGLMGEDGQLLGRIVSEEFQKQVARVLDFDEKRPIESADIEAYDRLRRVLRAQHIIDTYKRESGFTGYSPQQLMEARLELLQYGEADPFEDETAWSWLHGYESGEQSSED